MPHVVVEFSANLRGRADVPRLLRTVHDAALATGVFPRGGTRTRAEERTDYLIADGHPDNAFVHVTLRIGHGRDLETRKRAGQQVFDALCAEFVLAPSVLEVRNASDHRPYAEHYDDELVARVGALYAADVARFGYAFGAGPNEGTAG